MPGASVSPKVQKLIAKEMAAGAYRSEQELLVEALKALADRREAVAGIRRGLEDMQAGRMRPWKECRRDILRRHPNLADE